MSYTIDLHTHAYDSPDGSLQLIQYQTMLTNGVLDYIAITSHDSIQAAQRIQQELGDHIIVGEEITTQDGEIIGLYLTQEIPSGLTVQQAVAAIKEQHGLVYIPHPFETKRKGLQDSALRRIAPNVDIVEGYNGRAVFQNHSQKATTWASTYHKPIAASSDAHGWYGWGRTYSVLPQPPTCQTLSTLLGQATYKTHNPGIRGLLYPKINRLRHRNV